MITLDGKQLATKLRLQLKQEVTQVKNQYGLTPRLKVVLVGSYGPSLVYIRNKIRACQEIGIEAELVECPATINQEQFVAQLEALNQEANLDAVLVQFPLPAHLNPSLVYATLDPLKDVDSFTYASMGKLAAGVGLVSPCTPAGIMRLLQEYQISVAQKNIVVLGRSLIVGTPMAHLLTQANATVTICHSKTVQPRDYTQQADIVIVATHQRRFWGRDDFKAGSVIIDVGIHPAGDGLPLAGDVKFEELLDHCYAATPVPGGVGPMTIYMLLQNTLTLFKRVRLCLP